MTDFYLFPWDSRPAFSANTMISSEVEILIFYMVNQISWLELTGDPSAVLSVLVPDRISELADRLVFLS